MDFGWRPKPRWNVYRRNGALDISAYALDWRVKFGCRFDPDTGRWLPVFASGHITLDNGKATGARFVPGPNALISPSDAATPLFVQLSLGGETLWTGLALIEMGLSLREDDTVTWRLVSRYWQALNTPTLWRQTRSGITFQRPQAMLQAMLGQTLGASGLPQLSPVSIWPSALFLSNVAMRGTLGQNLSRLAHTCGVIPFEDRTGLPGMSSLERISEGRQSANPPASQIPIGDTKVRSVTTQSRWSIEALSQNVTAQPRETLVDFTAASYTAGEIVETVIRYNYPDRTVSINYEDPVAVDADVEIIHHSIRPDNTSEGRADIIVVRWRYNGSLNPATTFRVWGVRLAPDARVPYDIREFSYDDDLPVVQARVQQTDPWIDWFVSVGNITDGMTWRTMAQFINEPKARAVLTYPLWAADESDRIESNISSRSGLLVPASVSRYRINSAEVIDGVTETIELAGGASQVPEVTIEAITASGAATAAVPVDTGITISPTVPSPFDVPLAPDPTFTPAGHAAWQNLGNLRLGRGSNRFAVVTGRAPLDPGVIIDDGDMSANFGLLDFAPANAWGNPAAPFAGVIGLSVVTMSPRVQRGIRGVIANPAETYLRLMLMRVQGTDPDRDFTQVYFLSSDTTRSPSIVVRGGLFNRTYPQQSAGAILARAFGSSVHQDFTMDTWCPSVSLQSESDPTRNAALVWHLHSFNGVLWARCGASWLGPDLGGGRREVMTAGDWASVPGNIQAADVVDRYMGYPFVISSSSSQYRDQTQSTLIVRSGETWGIRRMVMIANLTGSYPDYVLDASVVFDDPPSPPDLIVADGARPIGIWDGLAGRTINAVGVMPDGEVVDGAGNSLSGRLP